MFHPCASVAHSRLLQSRRRPNIPTSLTSVPDHATSKEFQAPVRSWTPVISPSGAIFYTGELFPQWRNSLFVGGLSSTALIRLTFDNERVAVEERIHMARRICSGSETSRILRT